ncbi:large conductance mechanosensitive channel protein MscL [Nostoc sp. ATCC 53789]|uniref:large conductance mechanosensitive channel protein MscL n=1 Tax=Nostoc sp. ATCC 53789 TaxID=76335 RepID=UPI000DECD166|nr:large conductance mechanosensitive channel protein MscL [Nostoc sp. ATCC 53789]QHG18795.1 large conductance mechanosensitive channel protein MscL [Nostoc sp. ATCC 53789]RCJ22925.1 mechanosensitive ion channel protein MscL [Nostoc sp. ATCC 53789]
MARARRTSGFLRDFQEFAFKGNVIDLAIAVIIGTAFSRVITSFVEAVIMPLINPLIGVTGKELRTIAIGPGIVIGQFLGAIIDFLTIALILFVAIRALQKLKRQEDVPVESLTSDANVIAQERLTGALDRLSQTLESRNNQVL